MLVSDVQQTDSVIHTAKFKVHSPISYSFNKHLLESQELRRSWLDGHHSWPFWAHIKETGNSQLSQHHTLLETKHIKVAPDAAWAGQGAFQKSVHPCWFLKDVSSVIREILWEVTSMGTEEEREDSSGYTNLSCLGDVRKNFTIETSSFLRISCHTSKRAAFHNKRKKTLSEQKSETQVLSRNQCLCRYVGGQIGKCPWGHWFRSNLGLIYLLWASVHPNNLKLLRKASSCGIRMPWCLRVPVSGWLYPLPYWELTLSFSVLEHGLQPQGPLILGPGVHSLDPLVPGHGLQPQGLLITGHSLHPQYRIRSLILYSGN